MFDIGKNFRISRKISVSGIYGNVKRGKNSMIGPYVLISDGNHILKEKDIQIANQGGNFNQAIIEENVWVGCQSQVLMGVHLGSNSIVVANTTVVKSMDGGSLIVGTPAEIKKNIFLR